MYYTYVLRSSTTGRYYIGYSSDVEKRVKSHNNGLVRVTRSRGPWVLMHKEGFSSEKEAIQRERQIKSWKSRKAIERLFVL